MIKRKEFEAGTFKKRIFLDQRDHAISVFLKKNIGCAFKADEIAKRIKMNKDTVRSMLRKLIDKKLVKHKSPYFAWKK